MKRLFGLLLVLLSTSSFAYDYEMYRSAKKLNDASWNLVNRIEHKSTLSHLSDEARYLARQVSEFKSSVRHAESDFRVERSFVRVERAFTRLNDLLRRHRWARHYPSIRRDIERMRDEYYRTRDMVGDSFDRGYRTRRYGYAR